MAGLSFFWRANARGIAVSSPVARELSGRMKQVLVKGGSVFVEEVPPPSPGPGMALVRVSHSLISSGTESSFVDSHGLAGYALKKARDPLNVEKVKRKLASAGIRGTIEIVRNKLLEFQTPGYSSSGIIVSLGRDMGGFAVGDRVACAGVGYACHAEYNTVPRALLTPMPDAISHEEAAFVALGAIALHGVRQAQLTLGEVVVVSGLGLVGLLAVQLARASGARVIGCDPVESKRALALALGAEAACTPGALAARVEDISCGVGADAVLICAASHGSEVTVQALEVCRQRGRVVVVGAVGMQLPREPMYMKEIDFRLSCSYGPGRYQPAYEEHGVDYPVGYVRWTEGRNMAEFLRLVSVGAVQVKPLITAVHPVEEAAAAYAALSAGNPDFVAALLDYTGGQPMAAQVPAMGLTLRASTPPRQGSVGISLVGAGSFATAQHLPNVSKMDCCRLEVVCARTGPRAKQAAERFGARRATTCYLDAVGDPAVDAVIIATRHAMHAEIVLAALARGKHVFVEKPMALTMEEADAIVEEVQRSGRLLTVGFNRRMSRYAQAAREALRAAAGPPTILYRCNAGVLPPNHWTRDPSEGGRILGEAVHFFDLCCFLAGGRPVGVHAERLGETGHEHMDDTLSVALRMDNGALATVLYNTTGSASMGKERVEVMSGGGSIVIDDWKSITFHGLPGKNATSVTEDKGQAALMHNFIDAVQGKTELAVTAEDGWWATKIALEALHPGATG
jgi:predicted dehydrogenase/threonine dehydrogenase-like Zn-dependent dehydrogenase